MRGRILMRHFTKIFILAGLFLCSDGFAATGGGRGPSRFRQLIEWLQNWRQTRTEEEEIREDPTDEQVREERLRETRETLRQERRTAFQSPRPSPAGSPITPRRRPLTQAEVLQQQPTLPHRPSQRVLQHTAQKHFSTRQENPARRSE